jgi:hypothetical protein
MKACKFAYLSLVLVVLTWWIAGCAQGNNGGGPPPPITLSASPTSVDFGTVAVGSAQTKTVTLTASGSVSVTSSPLTGSSFFSVTGLTPPPTVGPSAPVTFSVTFAPQAAGAANATITINSNATSGAVTISLTGTGSTPATPTLSVSPPAVGFGSVTVGTTNSQPATMTALNGAVTVNSVNISDSQVTLTGIGFPLGLTANQTVPYTVVYHPTVANNNYSATITFSTTGTPNTTTQTVTAAATPPPVGSLVVPATINFGNVALGTSQTVSGTVQAVTAPVTLQTVAGPGPGVYSLSGLTLPLTIQPGVTITYSVTFNPSAFGTQTGSFTFSSNASNNPTTVQLTGNCVQPPTLTPAPDPMNFGSVAVGQTVSQSGTLSAAGGSVVITSTSTSDPQLTVTGLTFPQTVNNNTSIPFTVTYHPTTAGTGTFNGTVTFNLSASPFTVTENVGANPFNPLPHSVDLSWTASTSVVSGYNVYRGTQSGGPYTKLNVALVGGTTFTDNTVVAGNTYFYVVTAVDNLNHESPFSNEAKAVIPVP